MRIVKRVLIGLVVLIAVLCGVAFFLPQNVHVERSIVVAAPPEAVFPYVNSFARFNEWSPWAKLDPNAKYTFEGPAEGVGAKMTWTGNGDVGTGVQTILESEAPTRVKSSLEFGDGGPATASFLLAPEGEGTKITWTLDTDLGMNPVARWFGLFLDGMIGADYEKGLSNLKAVAEKARG